MIPCTFFPGDFIGGAETAAVFIATANSGDIDQYSDERKTSRYNEDVDHWSDERTTSRII